MRAVICEDKNLHLQILPDPIPKADELLVAVKAAGVNRADVLQRKGFYPPPKGASTVPGLEIAGEVVAVGASCKRFKIGQRVFGLVDGGGYGEHCTIPEVMAMPIPESWTYAYAAAIPEVFFTASETLFQVGSLKAGEEVLIHAGGSGVGSTAIQMARLAGARIATTAGSDEKLARCSDLGAHLTIPYKERDFVAEIQRWSEGGGVHLVLDFVGAAYLDRHLDVLRPLGRLVLVGLLGGAKAELNLGKVLMRRIRIYGSVMRSLPLADKVSIKERFLERWLEQIMRKSIEPVIFEKIPIENVRDAHKMMEADKHFGKIILTFV